MSEITSISRRILVQALKTLNDKDLFEYADKWEILVLSSDEDREFFYDDCQKIDSYTFSLTHEILILFLARADAKNYLSQDKKDIFVKYLSSNKQSSPELFDKMEKELGFNPVVKSDPLQDKAAE